MNKIIAIIASLFIAVLSLASCSLQGTWKFASATAQGCYSDNNCVPYSSIPCKINGCDVSIEGTLMFSGESKGTFTSDVTYIVKCPGKPAVTKRILEENLKYKIYKVKSKTYIYNYKYNTAHQLIIRENSLTVMWTTKTDSQDVHHFAARGLTPPAYILERYNYTRKAEEKTRDFVRSPRDF